MKRMTIAQQTRFHEDHIAITKTLSGNLAEKSQTVEILRKEIVRLEQARLRETDEHKSELNSHVMAHRQRIEHINQVLTRARDCLYAIPPAPGATLSADYLHGRMACAREIIMGLLPPF